MSVTKVIVYLGVIVCVLSLWGVLNPRGQERLWRRVTFWRRRPEGSRRDLVRRAILNLAVFLTLLITIALLVRAGWE